MCHDDGRQPQSFDVPRGFGVSLALLISTSHPLQKPTPTPFGLFCCHLTFVLVFSYSPMASVAICGYAWQNNNAARSESSVSLANNVCECPVGTYCPAGSAALFTPIACDTEDGNYCPKGSVSSSGEPCPTRSYCPGPATIIPCPAGTFSNATGLASSSECLQCEVGGYCEIGSSSTALCPAGTFQTELGQTSVAVRFDFLHCCCVRLFFICPFPLAKLIKIPPSSLSSR